MIVSVEIDHKAAPLKLREQLSLDAHDIPETLGQLLQGRGLATIPILHLGCDEDCERCSRAQFGEAAILSTCNRTGLYAVGGCAEPLARFLAGQQGSVPSQLRSHLNVYENRDAVRHLFATAAGLESQVLGEPQILGQIRDAYDRAQDADALGPLFDTFFRRAIRVGKRVRTETELGRHPASLGSVAVDLAAGIHPDFGQASAMLLGTGEMGELVARQLHKNGMSDVRIASRSRERAAELAAEFGGQTAGADELSRYLSSIDVLISATAPGKDHVVTSDQVEAAMRERHGRPLLLIDLAVPRTLDPQIRDVPNAHIHDLDDLKAVKDASQQRRASAVPDAERIVEAETEAFMSWLRQRRAIPLIKSLRHQAEEIRQHELEWARSKLGPLSEDQEEALQALTHRMMNKWLHTPTVQLKALAERSETCEPFTVARELFELDDVDHPHFDPSLQAEMAELNDVDGPPRTDASTDGRPDAHADGGPERELVLGTRGSTLARTQTNHVIAALRAHHPGLAPKTEIVKTRGDQGQVGDVGAFVTELQRALGEGEIDVAVHSHKDLPTETPADLSIVAVPERADPRDVLITRDGATLDGLPPGATVGTGSPRRAAQLLARRPDVATTFIQGNVDTRLQKLEDGVVDAIVLAAAGLARLDRLEIVSQFLDPTQVLPAPAQGALALEARADDDAVHEILAAIDDRTTHAAVVAERSCLAALGGGCRMPIAAYGRIAHGKLVLTGLVASLDGQTVLRDEIEGHPDHASQIGWHLGTTLWNAGADAILKEALQ